jgi:hypothetical protein
LEPRKKNKTMLVVKRGLAALLLLLPTLACSKKIRGEKAADTMRMLHEASETTVVVDLKTIDHIIETYDEETNDEDNEEVQANDHGGSKKSKHSDTDETDSVQALPRACSAYTACNGQLPGDCCPTVDNNYLACCFGEVSSPIPPAPVPSPVLSPTVAAPTQATRPVITAAECASNRYCAASGVTGMCCPTTDLQMLGKRERETQ